MQQLTEENFLIFAVKHYDNPTCTGIRDLENDLKRFKYIKRLLRRYSKTGKLTEKLVVNHFVVLHNLFGDGMVPMAFFRLDRSFWPQVKTFLVFLDLLPKDYRIRGTIPESNIPLDNTITPHLRTI